jgi:hypothetical protein
MKITHYSENQEDLKLSETRPLIDVNMEMTEVWHTLNKN